MKSLLQDGRYAFRILAKNPGFTFIALLTLGLGIGANTAIFSIVNAVLLKPLPYNEPDRIVSLWETKPNEVVTKWRVAPANFLDWRNQNQSFAEVAAFGYSALNLTGIGEPEQLFGARVTSGYFNVLGINPIHGRTFSPEECTRGKDQVVVLSYELWNQRFAADTTILGKTITLDGTPYSVIGVMPTGVYPTQPVTAGKYHFEPRQQQYWLPLALEGQWATNRNSHVYGVIGRLKSGVTREQAQAEMDSLGTQLEQQYEANNGEGILVNPFMKEVVGDVRPALFILLGAVGFVLLIACANVASLMLAQLASRRKEIVIRASLGASRSRLLSQFFVEGQILAVLGGIIGVGLAAFGIDLLVKLIPHEIPRLNTVHVNLSVLAFTFLLCVVSSLLFTLAPALHFSKANFQDFLKDGGRTSASGGGRQPLRRFLVVAQLCIAVILAVGAGLLIKSFFHLRQTEIGFVPERVLDLVINLPQSKYRENHQVVNFYNQLLEQLNNTKDVQVAALAYDHPLESNWIDSFTVVGREAGNQTYSANLHPVSKGYFRTVGVGIIQGREFDNLDDANHPGVIIINEAFAQNYFVNENPLGHHLQLSTPSRMFGNSLPTTFEIVGVARNVKSRGIEKTAETAYYLPIPQMPVSSVNILIKTAGDPLSKVATLRQAVWNLDADQPIAQITTMESLLADQLAQPRFNMLLMAIFGIVALTLAAIGIYGLLSFTVSQRTQEIGVRMAMGAQAKDVFQLIVGQGLSLTLIGIAMGLGGAFALTRLLSSLLYEVSTIDVPIFMVVSLLLLGVALIACLVPARRAAKTDPMVAIRYE